MKLIRSLFAVAAVAASLTLSVHAAPPAPETGTVDVKTGQTAIKLDQVFTTALTAGEIAVAKISPGKTVLPKGELRFPIAGGAIDLATLVSEVIHSGGVNFSKGDVSVSVVDLIVSIPGGEVTPGISAVVVVNGQSLGRVALFDIEATLTAPLELPKNKKIVVKDVSVTLTEAGATALNEAFGFEVPVFTSETVVGTATISATVEKNLL